MAYEDSILEMAFNYIKDTDGVLNVETGECEYSEEYRLIQGLLKYISYQIPQKSTRSSDHDRMTMKNAVGEVEFTEIFKSHICAERNGPFRPQDFDMEVAKELYIRENIRERIGEFVFVPTGEIKFAIGVLVGCGYYDSNWEQLSYRVCIHIDKEYSFTDYFPAVYDLNKELIDISK